MKKTFVRQARLPKGSITYDLETSIGYFKWKAAQKRKEEEREKTKQQNT